MLCCRLRDTYQDGRVETEYTIIQGLASPDVLLIDDLGTTTSGTDEETDFSLRTVLNILDERLVHCKPTWLTTNKSIEQLGVSFDARLASRLQQICEVLHLTGEDKRVQNSVQGYGG